MANKRELIKTLRNFCSTYNYVKAVADNLLTATQFLEYYDIDISKNFPDRFEIYLQQRYYACITPKMYALIKKKGRIDPEYEKWLSNNELLNGLQGMGD